MKDRIVLSWLFTIATLLCLRAQTTLPTGVVNAYRPVTAMSGKTLTVGASTGATHTWAVGDKVLFIQMTGTTSSGAGRMEYSTIASLTGSTITLSSLTRTYATPSATALFQLVWVPNDPAGFIVPSGGVVAKDWDGSTGGIVTLTTTGTLTMNGNISADGAGFRYADGTNTISGPDIYMGGGGGGSFWWKGGGGGGGGYGSAGKGGQGAATDANYNGGTSVNYGQEDNPSGGGGGGGGVGGAGSGGASGPHGGGGGGGAGYGRGANGGVSSSRAVGGNGSSTDTDQNGKKSADASNVFCSGGG